MLLLVVAGTVKAESPEVSPVETATDLQSENKQESDVSSEEAAPVAKTAVQEIEWADEEDEDYEDYNIYKKHNPEDPCDRGLDTYDYEKKLVR